MPRTYEQRFKRLMKTAATYRPHKYQSEFVQPEFNRMIRAEAAAVVGVVPAVVGGTIYDMASPLGYCVCVTCGDLHEWNKPKHFGGRLDSGHFLTGNRISLEETNCHPQCSTCNSWGSGQSSDYRLFMVHVYGQDEIDRLMQLKNARNYEPPTREWLIEKRIEFEDRTASAVAKMG